MSLAQMQVWLLRKPAKVLKLYNVFLFCQRLLKKKYQETADPLCIRSVSSFRLPTPTAQPTVNSINKPCEFWKIFWVACRFFLILFKTGQEKHLATTINNSLQRTGLANVCLLRAAVHDAPLDSHVPESHHQDVRIVEEGRFHATQTVD